MYDTLPPWRRPLAVVAHPDDESFGLGAVLSAFAAGGANPAVLCFTHGEASTVHGVDGDLRTIRAAELRRAAEVLGLGPVRLSDYPDGALAALDAGLLSEEVAEMARDWDADGLLVFDSTGITGHPDHIAATRFAVQAAISLCLPVLAWTLPTATTQTLNSELGTGFVGRPDTEIDVVITVDRRLQREAVRAHPSQAVPTSAPVAPARAARGPRVPARARSAVRPMTAPGQP